MTRPADLRISQLSVIEFINCFSLLVVAGSISTSYFFSQIFHTVLPFSFYWLLGSTIWIIYSLDHILDGMKLGSESVSIRHYVHYKYRKVLIPTLSAIAVFNLIIAYFFLPKSILYGGVAIAGLVVTYFAVIHLFKPLKIHWLKELFVSLVVCLAMVVLPGIAGDLSFEPATLSIVLCMVLINFSNLILFSYFDYDSDVKNGLSSAATHWGKEKTRWVIMNVLGSAFALFVVWTFLVVTPIKLPVSVALLLMFNVLLILFIQEERFAEKERYRFWGDFIFLIPGLTWWVLTHQDFFSYLRPD